MTENIVGVLIAGGYSRRFGKPKAFAVKNGRYFFQYSIQALRTVSEQTVIITNEALEKKFNEKADTTILTDLECVKGKGPLAGLYTVMEERHADWYAIAPVDTPFIEAEIYQKLLKNMEAGDEAIIAVANERVQPLIALYHRSLKPVIKKLLESNQLAIQALLDQVNTKYISFTASDAFININVQSDYQRYIKDGRAGDYA